MKPTLLLLISISTSLCSCDDGPCGVTTFGHEILTHKSIVYTPDSTQHYQNFEIIEGDHLVFHFFRHHDNCPGVADDDYTLTMAFEIDSSIHDFAIRDSALLGAHCFVHRSGTWVNEDFFVKEGFIEGYQTGPSKWVINAVVMTVPNHPHSNPSYTVSVHQIFQKK